MTAEQAVADVRRAVERAGRRDLAHSGRPL